MARKITRRKTPLDLQPLTKETLRIIAKDMAEHLTIIGKERGITFSMGTFSYDPLVSNFSVKVKGVMKGGKTREETLYEQNYIPLGLPKINTVFEFQGSKYKIIGYRPRARKQPILTEKIGANKKFTFSIELIKSVAK